MEHVHGVGQWVYDVSKGAVDFVYGVGHDGVAAVTNAFHGLGGMF